MSEYIRARAPLRIGIAGGGTDVDPYASTKGGCVFNTTINKYAYCTLVPRTDCVMSVQSKYYGRYQIPLDNGPLEFDGNMDLIKAVANHFELKRGFDITIQSDVPAGSGLGGSSTMMVALIAAAANWTETNMDKYEMAKLAYTLERIDIGLKGGRQDQYAAVFGGFNLLDIDADGVKVKPVIIDPDVINELQCRSVLCYTGVSRDSSTVIDSQIQSFKQGSNESALDASKKLAREISSSVRAGDLEKTGVLLDQAWSLKKQFSNNISNSNINKLYDVAMKNGAIGGKVSGAGGGGFMYFICEYDKKAQVANELRKSGAEITDFMFDPHGVTSWRSNNE
jgi:D-glycero-alpha-D-manno-heptose-7-phosphate kinase